jgi:hypothetical protein
MWDCGDRVGLGKPLWSDDWGESAEQRHTFGSKANHGAELLGTINSPRTCTVPLPLPTHRRRSA